MYCQRRGRSAGLGAGSPRVLQVRRAGVHVYSLEVYRGFDQRLSDTRSSLEKRRRAYHNRLANEHSTNGIVR